MKYLILLLFAVFATAQPVDVYVGFYADGQVKESVVYKMDNRYVAKETVGISLHKNTNPSKATVRVVMPCENPINLDLQKIPMRDIPCPCGNKTHWLFRIRK